MEHKGEAFPRKSLINKSLILFVILKLRFSVEENRSEIINLIKWI